MPKILVCGGRNYNNKCVVYNTLYRICDNRGWNYEPDSYGNYLPNVTIIHGGCKTGTDRLADEWAIVNWTGLKVCEAQWHLFGKAAGPMRNELMLLHAPDLVVAFPGGKGTADMIKRTKKAGFEVIEFMDEP